MGIVKDWKFKRLFYDEEEEVLILPKKVFILKKLSKA